MSAVCPLLSPYTHPHVRARVRANTGVRASYLTKDFRLRSHLLAAKQYMPRRHETHSGSANNHGDGDGDNEQNENGNEGRLIRRWVEQALWEFGLDWSLVLSAVVDGSPEMRAAFRGVRGVWTESCISHVLSGVIVSGFGLSRNPRESSNPAARAVVMSMRRILENVRCSSGAQVRIFICIRLYTALSLHVHVAKRSYTPRQYPRYISYNVPGVCRVQVQTCAAVVVN